jgi:hypothetical protein
MPDHIEECQGWARTICDHINYTVGTSALKNGTRSLLWQIANKVFRLPPQKT